jgi:predicted DNA-binding WGR domain protein
MRPSEPPVIASATTPKPLAAASATSHCRYVCTEDGSSKFWEVSLTDTELTVRFGRIGTKGQSQTRTFTTAEAAQHEQSKLIRSKVAKGYTEEPFRTTDS